MVVPIVMHTSHDISQSDPFSLQRAYRLGIISVGGYNIPSISTLWRNRVWFTRLVLVMPRDVTVYCTWDITACSRGTKGLDGTFVVVIPRITTNAIPLG